MEIADKSAERKLLQDIMCDNSVLDTISIEIGDFYTEAYKVIYDCMLRLHSRNETIDRITLSDELTKVGKLEDIGGMTAVLDIDSAFTVAGVKEHANIVKKKSITRAMYDISQHIVSDIQGNIENDEIIANTTKLLDDILKNNQSDSIQHCRKALDDFFSTLEKSDSLGMSGQPTSFSDFDDITGGFQKGTLNILAARTGMGKTAFALNLAQRIVKMGKKILFFSLEMSAEQLISRIISMVSGVVGDKFKHPKELTSDDWENLWKAAEEISQYEFYIDDTPGTRPVDVRKKAIEMKHKYGLDMIIVDYLQFMNGDTKNKDRYLEVSEISKSLKNIAKELDIPVIALAQLSRDIEKRQDKHPMLSDLRESGSIEQDADLVMFLYRDDYYNPDTEVPNTAELVIAKHRAGERGTVNLYFDANTTTFRSLSKVHGMEVA